MLLDYLNESANVAEYYGALKPPALTKFAKLTFAL